MQVLTSKSANKLVTTLYPVIKFWLVNRPQYKLPSIAWLAKHSFQFLKTESFKVTYKGKIIAALGLYDCDPGIIKVAYARDKVAVISTIIHELGHAIQFFNLGAKFTPEYNREAKLKTHSNKFEAECRLLQSCLEIMLLNNTKLRITCDKLTWDFESAYNWDASYRIRRKEDYSNSREFNTYRTKWWLRH